jgi:N6-L-threonylcarbamoyladenine synthase
MKTNSYFLGIDTSNYTTSVAVIDENGEVIHDLRNILAVKQGERGLQQSSALFQHLEELPKLLKMATQGITQNIKAVAVSTRPRPLESSYMPVFKAGENFAKVIANTLEVLLVEVSHQEGHIEAVKAYSSFKDKKKFLCYQLSGGTCELLKIDGETVEIIGGTKDISFGQVVDRLGVLLGLNFPCGSEMDKMALSACSVEKITGLKPCHVDGLYINLSGMETQGAKVLAQLNSKYDGPISTSEHKQKEQEMAMFVKAIFNNIGNALINLTENAALQTGIRDFLFTGGVSSSQYLYNMLNTHFDNSNIQIEFGKQDLAPDNGVGVALLGLQKTSE